MLERDFFAFCTSLRPLELKAIGELSEIRHLGDSKVIYSPGDPGDTLYIINRGVVEVVKEEPKRGGTMVYLSRGDIFGDVETLTGLPRKHLIRTCEPVSLQCFSMKSFPELVRRVPMFFKYLSAHLASRLLQASDLALAQSHCLELSGSLSNFDLVTIYQTIVNSSQTGELCILNDTSETVCAFFFEEGKPRCGQFQHLTGEEAFWQLFLSEEMPGTFSFSAGERPISDSIQAGRIERHPGDMLINALQGRDEILELKTRMAFSAKLLRKKLNFSWPAGAPEELRPAAEQIWQIAYSTPVAISSLYQHCSVCELKIYQIVDELLKSQHFTLSSTENCEKVA